MNTPSVSIISQLRQIRKLFAEASPTDSKIINEYAWAIAKGLNREHENLDSIECRQFLAEYLRLPVERPSNLHSAILAAAIKVAQDYPEFRFAAFLRMWDAKNLRTEDFEKQKTQDGSTFPSLAERTARVLGRSLLLHPEDHSSHPSVSVESAADSNDTTSSVDSILISFGYSILPMLVTRIKEAMGKDGRKYFFVTLTSPQGIEAETVLQILQPSPLHPLPQGKRHYVNIGQLYDVLLRRKTATASSAAHSDYAVADAFLSSKRPIDCFPATVGYIEHIDPEHSHMHVYDAQSRHFVAPLLRFSKERVGEFVRFIPIVPATSRFKSAIILGTIHSSSDEVRAILRNILITSINEENGYAAWELIDSEHPITEQLSPLQLSQGEVSPAFTCGYFNLAPASEGSVQEHRSFVPLFEPVSDGTAIAPFAPGQTFQALVYLKRGKDGQKRPHVARIFSDVR